MNFYQVNIKSINWRLNSNHNFAIVTASNKIIAAQSIHRRGFLCVGVTKTVDAPNLEQAIESVKQRIYSKVKLEAGIQRKSICFKATLVYAQSRFSGEVVAFILHTDSQATTRKLISTPYWIYNYSEPLTIEHTFEPQPSKLGTWFRSWLW